MWAPAVPVPGASKRQILRSSLQGGRIQGRRDRVPMQPWTMPANRMKDGNLLRGGMHHRLAKTNVGTETRRVMFTLWAVAALLALPALARAQALADSGDSPAAIASTVPAPPDLTYVRPTGAT